MTDGPSESYMKWWLQQNPAVVDETDDAERMAASLCGNCERTWPECTCGRRTIYG